MSTLPPESCPRCGSQRAVRILWDAHLPLDDRDQADLEAGRLILGRTGTPYSYRRRPTTGVPGWGCMECVPLWSEVHRLARIDMDFQEAKSAAVEEQDFERAASLLAQQDRLAPENAAVVERLRSCLCPPPLPSEYPARWRTSDVVGLARGIDEDRAYDRMPLLGDALMDAGADEQLLVHARADGHVRGCWLVDLVLGKE